MEKVQSNLPTFFQSGGGGTTILDELVNFDFNENHDESTDELDAIIDEIPLDPDGDIGEGHLEEEEVLTNSFGDFNLQKLPDYLQQQSYITPGRNAIPENDDDDDADIDLAEILNKSTEERLKDHAASIALSKVLGTPLTKSHQNHHPNSNNNNNHNSHNNNTSSKITSGSKPPGLTPGLPPGLSHQNTPTSATATGNPFTSPSSAQSTGNNNGYGSFPTPASILSTPYSNQKVSSNPPGLLPARDLLSSFPPSTPPPLTPRDPTVPGSAASVVSSILSPPPAPPLDGSPVPFFTPKQNFGRGKYMHTSDVRFVINKVLQPLETQDPYADDFYFIQYTIKKNAIEREKALQEQRGPPPPIKVPLPTWKDTKERIKGQLLQSRAAFQAKVKDWEEKEQVLGHRIRSDVSRPRELLTLPIIQDLDFDLNDDDDLEWRAPFTSRLWSTRLAVQRGYEALYTVQELQYLLTSPLIQANHQAIEEIKHEIDLAILILSQSLGIRTIENESFLGLNTGTSIQLDGRHVAAILQTAMGKKLLTRGLKLLSPQHRWILIPVVLARILMTISPAATTATTTAPSNPTGGSGATSSSGEGIEVEKKLLKTIIEYLQFTYKQYTEIRNNRVEIAISYANDLIINLKQVLKNVMITQLEKNQLKESLLSERTRAEVMHVIVSLGDNVTAIADSQMKVEWRQTKDAFMSLLD